MLRKLITFQLIIFLVFIAFTGFFARFAEAAFVDAHIMYSSCDPLRNGCSPAKNDYDKWLKENFKVRVGYVDELNLPTIASNLAAGDKGHVCYDYLLRSEAEKFTCRLKVYENAYSIYGGYSKELEIGGPNVEIFGGTLTLKFKVQREGDRACVYGWNLLTGIEALDWAKEPVTRLPYSKIAEDYKYTKLPKNCIFLPQPYIETKPQWNANFVSPVCTDYKAGDYKSERPFTGVVVQCVEDTIMNIFVKNFTENSGSSFFDIMQERLKSSIRALLAMYIIFLGYQYIISPGKIKAKEWNGIALKIMLVIYFAAGPGMKDLLPMILDATKDMSRIILEAGMTKYTPEIFKSDLINDPEVKDNIASAGDPLAKAKEELESKRRLVTQKRKSVSSNQSDVDSSTGSAKDVAEQNLSAAKKSRDAAYEEYQKAVRQHYRVGHIKASYGYAYCDFRGQTYPEGKSFYALWDMIDCKLAKYLGVGENKADKDVPQVIVIAAASLFSTVYGILIWLLTLAMLAFIVLIAVRIVQTYIVAFVVVVILVYISPLIIPAMLFKFTKPIFDKWVKQIMGFAIQPIIMFAFLSLMFGVFDQIIYEDNKIFNADNTIASVDGQCGDKKRSLGCVYQEVKLATSEGINLGNDFKFSKIENFSNGDAEKAVESLLKMFFASFLVFAALGLVEDMSSKLTDSASAAKMAGVKAADPVSALKGAGSANLKALKATKLGAKATGILGGKAARAGGRAAFNNSRHIRAATQNIKAVGDALKGKK
ncbi:type IV secretion system protein [Rickettsiales bacterium]|nr:type IV secretion system protein [Rickettsiales bacterium]